MKKYFSLKSQTMKTVIIRVILVFILSNLLGLYLFGKFEPIFFVAGLFGQLLAESLFASIYFLNHKNKN